MSAFFFHVELACQATLSGHPTWPTRHGRSLVVAVVEVAVPVFVGVMVVARTAVELVAIALTVTLAVVFEVVCGAMEVAVLAK